MGGPKMRNPTGSGSGFNSPESIDEVPRNHSTAKKKYTPTQLDKKAWRFAVNLKDQLGMLRGSHPLPLEHVMAWAETNKIDVHKAIALVSYAWEKPVPDGNTTLEHKLGNWKADPVPEVGTPALRTGHYANALKVFAAMQRAEGQGVAWYLGERRLGDLLGVTRKTARSYFRCALHDGVLIKVADATPNVKSREWIMPDAFDEQVPDASDDDDTSLPF